MPFIFHVQLNNFLSKTHHNICRNYGKLDKQLMNILASHWEFHSAPLVLKGFLEQFHPGMEKSQTLMFKWEKVNNWEELRQDGAFNEFVIMVF